MDKVKKWIALSAACGGSRAELERLCAEYEAVSDSDPRLCTEEAEALFNSLDNPPVDGVTVLIYPDAVYPQKLKQLKNPPAALYVRGDPGIISRCPYIAVVGSREASLYGMTVTADLCRDFCEAGFGVITGGAKGVDSAAAQTAVKFGGKVILVLGCGVDVVYPPENGELFSQVVDGGGAIVSEFPFGTLPLPILFPRRNRIIAALCDGCVVTEAGLRSGALITADHCLDLRRPLYAVPGNITSPGSAGTNGLIRSGALMATDGMSVAAEIKLSLSFDGENLAAEPTGKEIHSAGKKAVPSIKKEPERQKPAGLSAEEEKVIDAIQSNKTSPDEISRFTGFDEAALAPMLVMLELKGVIERKFGGRYMVK